VAAGSLRSSAATIINAPQLSAIVRLRCLVSRPTRQGVTTNFGIDVLMEFRAALNVSLCERKGVLTDLPSLARSQSICSSAHSEAKII
jgi:hypothetical protein